MFDIHRAPGGLFLFDVDWTLLKGGISAHHDAFAHAFHAVYGQDVSLDGIAAAGRTDTWLLAEPLRRAGVPDREIWSRMPEAFAVMGEYVEANLGNIADYVLPGVHEVLQGLLARGQILGLLTGNLQRIAAAKMYHAGLDGYFAVGGFGDESEIRSRLVTVALEEASRVAGTDIQPGRTVVIGDTPLDVEAGRAAGTRTAGVATGPYTSEALRAAGADLVLASFAPPEPAVSSLLALAR